LIESVTVEGNEQDVDARVLALDAQTEKRLRTHWDAVERVATKLLERETLSCAEVDDCITSTRAAVAAGDA
jgi:hypothetical protein